MSLGWVLRNRSHRRDSTFNYVKPVIRERGSNSIRSLIIGERVDLRHSI
jgi:hypothetical protein